MISRRNWSLKILVPVIFPLFCLKDRWFIAALAFKVTYFGRAMAFFEKILEWKKKINYFYWIQPCQFWSNAIAYWWTNLFVVHSRNRLFGERQQGHIFVRNSLSIAKPDLQTGFYQRQLAWHGPLKFNSFLHSYSNLSIRGSNYVISWFPSNFDSRHRGQEIYKQIYSSKIDFLVFPMLYSYQQKCFETQKCLNFALYHL